MSRLRIFLHGWLLWAAVRVLNPPPVKTEQPSVHDLVVGDIRGGKYADAIPTILDRKALGLAKYGTILQVGNRRSHRRDALQEAGDLVVYLRAEVEDSRGESKRRAILDYNAAVMLLCSIRRRMHRE